MKMKRHILAPIVGLMAAASVVHAAAPTENQCSAAAKAAVQLRSAGNFSAARARLAACLSTECSRQVRDECARQVAAIDVAMPAVLLEAKDESSNNVSAVRVTMDGAPLVDRLEGTAILVNPGQHTLAFDAAGFRRTETTFVARERQKKLRVVVFLDSAQKSPDPTQLIVSPATSAPASAPASSLTSALDSREEPARSSARSRRYVALALGGAGIAGVTVGTIWAIMAKTTYDHALVTECGGEQNLCTSGGIAEGRTAHRQATAATVAFVAAGALFAAGAALYFTSPKETGVAVAPTTVDGSGGLTVVGKW